MLWPRYGWSLRQASALLLVPDMYCELSDTDYNDLIVLVVFIISITSDCVCLCSVILPAQV